MVIGYIIVVLVLALGYFLLLRKYKILWQNLPISDTVFTSFECSVSILIPFRNEAQNLPKLLDAINALEIQSHDIELIFIDDHSSDNGLSIIKEYNLNFPVNIFSLKQRKGKKEAIKQGWKAASGDIILQTDADCVFGRDWLLTMVESFVNEDILLVGGPVSYQKKSGFFNQLVALDFYGLIAIGAAHIEWQLPMICNGANLAYRKSLVADIDLRSEKASGDDVFILQSAHHLNKNGILFKKNRAALVETSPPKNLSSFWHQRLRWASKNSDYSLRQNSVILIFVWIYNVTILVSLLSMQPVGLLSAVFLVLVKFMIEEQFYSAFLSFFSKEKWRQTLLFGQPFHIFYMTIVPPISQLVKYKWKDRKLK